VDGPEIVPTPNPAAVWDPSQVMLRTARQADAKRGVMGSALMALADRGTATCYVEVDSARPQSINMPHHMGLAGTWCFPSASRTLVAWAETEHASRFQPSILSDSLSAALAAGIIAPPTRAATSQHSQTPALHGPAKAPESRIVHPYRGARLCESRLPAPRDKEENSRFACARMRLRGEKTDSRIIDLSVKLLPVS
jgi:hypothetical protein